MSKKHTDAKRFNIPFADHAIANIITSEKQCDI